MEKKDYVIVRSESAGVFAGTLESKNGDEVLMSNARRLWYWEGAASLSELAVRGVSKPNKCKFPVEMPKVTVLKVIEIIAVSAAARDSIAAVPVWSA